MAKMTKREYTKARAELDRRIQVAEANCDTLHGWFDTMTTPLSTGDSLFVTQLFNDMNDIARDLACQRDDLDDRFRRRNWTSQDYAAWSLVCNNCD